MHSRTNLPKESSSSRVECAVLVLLLSPGSIILLILWLFDRESSVGEEGNVGMSLAINLLPNLQGNALEHQV